MQYLKEKNHIISILLISILIIIMGFENIGLRINYNLNENGKIQLFYNSGKKNEYPFKEEASSRQNIYVHKNGYIKFKTNFKSIEKLRFDFDEINNIEIKDINISIYGVNILKYTGLDISKKITSQNDISIGNKNEVMQIKSDGEDSYVEIDNFIDKDLQNIIYIVSITLGLLISVIFNIGLIYIINNKQRFKSILALFNDNRDIFLYILLSLLTVLIVEIIHRGSISEAVQFIMNRTEVFIINYLIILMILSPMILFNNIIVFVIIFEVIVLLSCISATIGYFRGYPLTFIDIYSLMDGLSILENYIDFNMIILISIFFISMFILILIGYKLSKKYNLNNKLKISILFIIFLIFIYNKMIIFVVNNEILFNDQSDLKSSYKQNGFIYSYINSFISYKKEVPLEYSNENIKKINKEFYTYKEEEKDRMNPNIIFMQLESVMDLSDIGILDLSGDPLLNIKNLSSRYSSGTLSVPTVGGGTARSEFEILTGYPIDYMMPGEIPHMSILKHKNIESIASCLDKYGYDSILIHNYYGDFYDRNIAYKNLGFDRYISMEYMYGIDRSSGWPKDEILLDNIKNVLQNNDKPKLIYSIGVQTHGNYDKNYKNTKSKIKVNGNLDKDIKSQAQHYVDNLVEVDELINDVIKYIEELDDPTILVVFSDHLPKLADGTDKYISEDKQFLTNYFIYNNIGLKKKDEDLEAYQLSTKLFEDLELDGNIINEVHKKYRNKDNSEYQKVIELVQYDLLYGKKYLGVNNYKEKNMELGLQDIVIDGINVYDEYIEVKGNGFNEFSRIYLDKEEKETKYINKNTLIYNGKLNINNKEIVVKQLGRYNKGIGETTAYRIER